MAEIRHRVGIKGSQADIYRQLTTDTGLSKWWTTDTSGAGDVGSIIYFRFGNDGPRFEVIELQADQRVRWRHHGEMPGGWMGTEILFELEPDDKQTIVNFSHYNWRQADDFLAHCSTKWGVFMMSLKSSIETGRGRPYPDDVHIDYDE
ncbi:MAG: SRPBCC domain-containing protein [Gammaproteobacteria bacterium]|nr:MAG: SRPBCC domain-containing protein [Gammaproteobacteria bacterium]